MTKLSDPQALAAYVDQVAGHRGWIVNPDRDFVGPILEGLAARARQWGKPYCPCRDADGTPADRDIVCPCAYAQADIQEHGQCYCALFLVPGKDPRTVSSIPERRP